MSSPTPYDAFAYRGFAYSDTHPARLATMAALYGMNPCPVARCRVLELGCGIGANIIPMAAQYPDSEFIGIDLSARSIEAGSGVVSTLGLTNISLRHASITDVDAAYGLFDYISAHGVYSWVPPPVRDKLLAIYHDNLAPQGVAYVSYNAHPGSRLRDMVRDMMLFHVRDIADPTERVGQARAVAKAIAEATTKGTVHQAVVDEQLKRIDKMGDDVLFHDDLDEGADAFLLHEVVAAAERHGLQYLSDSVLGRRSLERLPDTMKGLLSQFTASAYMARDQYHDFIDGHAFRKTLLCHRDIRLNRDVTPQHLERFHLSSELKPTAPDVDPIAAGAAEFKTKRDDTLGTNHALTKAALLHLGEIWPAAAHTTDLLAAARTRLISGGAAPESYTDQEAAATTKVLFDLVCGGHIELHFEAPACVTTISARPQVSRFARVQLKNGELVTTLRHETVNLNDELTRDFVQLVDGTRNIDRLVTDFASMVAQSSDLEARDKPVNAEIVEHNLKMLAKLALLIA